MELAMHLSCAKCGRVLTVECRLGIPDDHIRDPGMREPAVTQGVVVVLPDEDTAKTIKEGPVVRLRVRSPPGAFAVNPLDIRSDALVSVGIDNGCCGSDGMDGPNRGCVCGAVLGTEWSDCWTQAEVRFNPEAVMLG
jgi:hypothetical protein